MIVPRTSRSHVVFTFATPRLRVKPPLSLCCIPAPIPWLLSLASMMAMGMFGLWNSRKSANMRSPRMTVFPRTITGPSVKKYCSRICRIMSHPVDSRAGLMNFVQISRSVRLFLSISSISSGPPRMSLPIMYERSAMLRRRSACVNVRREIKSSDGGDQTPAKRVHFCIPACTLGGCLVGNSPRFRACFCQSRIG